MKYNDNDYINIYPDFIWHLRTRSARIMSPRRSLMHFVSTQFRLVKIRWDLNANLNLPMQVVFGGGNYSALLPPKSFVDARQFSSPRGYHLQFAHFEKTLTSAWFKDWVLWYWNSLWSNLSSRVGFAKHVYLFFFSHTFPIHQNLRGILARF